MVTAVWEAVETDGFIKNAHDAATGALMRIYSTPEVDVERVVVQLPDEKQISFSIAYRPKKGVFSGNDSENPMIQLFVGSFIYLIKQKPSSFNENTALVRYVIDGLATINRKWPLCPSPYFYSDLKSHLERNGELKEFDFPSDDELARL